MVPIKGFYDAFCARDGETMASLYADKANWCHPLITGKQRRRRYDCQAYLDILTRDTTTRSG